jgi:3-oxoacyl-[acyl-carrier protein] reductase
MRELEGRIALVTGASRGIGRAIAVALGRLGAKVVVNYTANETAASDAAAAVVAAGGTSITKRFDVSDPVAVDAAIKEIIAGEGGLHILVNNAGIAINTLVLGAKDADWKRTLDVNLTGTFNCCRAALRALMKAREAGRIINITSITGEIG